jgi:hypothetical protein
VEHALSNAMSMKDILHTNNDPDQYWGPSSIQSGHLPTQQNGIPQALPPVCLNNLTDREKQEEGRQQVNA